MLYLYYNTGRFINQELNFKNINFGFSRKIAIFYAVFRVFIMKILFFKNKFTFYIDIYIFSIYNINIPVIYYL